MTSLLFYTLLSSAVFYLTVLAEITRFLWSRYPSRIARFLECPACQSFWSALLLSYFFGFDFFGVSGWYKPVVVGFCVMVCTPIVIALMISALKRSQIVPDDAPSNQ